MKSPTGHHPHAGLRGLLALIALSPGRKRTLALAAGVLVLLWAGLGVLGSVRTAVFLARLGPDGYIGWSGDRVSYLDSLPKRFRGRGVNLKIFTIVPKMHYWTIINTLGVDIDTVAGCNPFLRSFNAVVGERIACVDRKGALHRVSGGETVRALSRLYHVPVRNILSANRLGPFSLLRRGDVIFIPGGLPRIMTPLMNMAYLKRKIFAVPTNGWVASRGFGMQIHPFTGKMTFHKGIDMKASEGTPIFAAAEGRVACAGDVQGYGNLIILEHANGYSTYYGHCSRIFVRLGQSVKKKQCIGRVGATGLATVAHLHFEIRSNSKPVDPLKFLW